MCYSQEQGPCVRNKRSIGQGYIPKIRDHRYHLGKLVLPATWRSGDFYQGTQHWVEMGLIGYDARHTYCSMRGDDLADDLPSWEATTELMLTRTTTLHRIIDLIIKLTSEIIDMGRFPSRDSGPWESSSERKIWPLQSSRDSLLKRIPLSSYWRHQRKP